MIRRVYLATLAIAGIALCILTGLSLMRRVPHADVGVCAVLLAGLWLLWPFVGKRKGATPTAS